MTVQSITELFRDAEQHEAAGNPAEAINLYKRWIALNPSDPHAHAVIFNYAVIMSRHGDKAGAMIALRDAIRQKPDFSPPYINLGRLLEDAGQSGSAVTQWLELVNKLGQLNGDNLRHKLMALQQIGRVLEGNHVDGAAEDALRQSIDLRPNQPEVVQHWLALRQKQCKWPVAQPWDGVTRKQLIENISPLSAAVMFDDPVFQLARAYRYAKESIARPKSRPYTHGARDRKRPAKLKIGYVSSDLREHAVGFGLSEVMEVHDRSRYEIHAYYCGIAREDPTKARIRGTVDRWTDINGISDDDVAARILADGIDILVDVNGYTRDARTPVFARRPAPIQVNWYGFPGTMGSPYHHYIIGDPHVIPEGHEHFFTEKVLRLPCYQPNDRKRKVAEGMPARKDENLPETGFVFCCLNGTQKISESVFAAWMEILRGVEGSVLWLLDASEDTAKRLREMAQKAGVEEHRLCFAPRRPNPQHLARYRLADLFLDTFPYGAHTTASDAMWMGTPVLALQGKGFASRVCAGLISCAGIPEMVCNDIGEYVRKAIEVGNNRELAQQLRWKLETGRDSCTLFDTNLLVTSLEGLYEQMWEDFARDELPVPNLTNLDVYAEIGVELHCEINSGVAGPEDYRDRLESWNAHNPLLPDGRLWQPEPVAASGAALLEALENVARMSRGRTPEGSGTKKIRRAG